MSVLCSPSVFFDFTFDVNFSVGDQMISKISKTLKQNIWEIYSNSCRKTTFVYFLQVLWSIITLKYKLFL